MTQVEDQASQAEERSQETRSFVRQVRAATRRKYTPSIPLVENYPYRGM